MSDKKELLNLYFEDTALGSKEKFLLAVRRIEEKFEAKCAMLQKESKELSTVDIEAAADVAKEFLDTAEEFYVFKKILDMAILKATEDFEVIEQLQNTSCKGNLN